MDSAKRRSKEPENRTVSVAISTYCGEKFVAEQIGSILAQDSAPFEIVLCDDCSKDRTVELAKKLLEGSAIGARIIENSSNFGVTKNFEKCIMLCNGDIVLTADQDDVWESDKVSELIRAFDDPEVVLAYSDAAIIDGEGNELVSSLYRRDGFWPEPFSQKAFEDAVVRLSQTVYGCTMAFRRDFVQKIIPFMDTKANHDAWIMCCAPLYGKVAFVPKPLMSYRIHGKNTVASLNGSKEWEGICAAQDEFDRYFAIQPLRTLRLQILREAASRAEKQRLNVRYRKAIKRANRLYSRLNEMKNRGRLFSAFKLAESLVDGSYRYRCCDRGTRIGTVGRAKRFVRDMIYLLRR